MGFNKKYINKDKIMEAIKLNSLSKLTDDSDALIMDSWASKFFDNYDFNSSYKNYRDKLDDDTKYSSVHHVIYNHENFGKLKKLSNILENLIREESWIDVLLAFDLMVDLGIIYEVTDDMKGKYRKLRELCINKIVNHYTTESSDKIIETILE